MAKHKVVINRASYSWFRLSEKAVRRYEEISGKELPSWDDISRHDPALVQVVEELGEDANGDTARLFVEEIPGNRYRIEKDDRREEEVFCPEDENWIVIED